MSKKKELIPELRFPEFVNEGEWEEKEISDIGETINGLTGKSGKDFGAGKPYVTYKQVFDDSLIDFEKCGKVQIDENENQNDLEKGDILFTTSSETPNEVGFASVLVDSPKTKTYLNSFCFALRPFSLKETRPEFSRYLFHSPAYRKVITALAQGSTRYNISKGAFKNLKVPIPKPIEQQKIASCLSSLDEVIAAQSQKLGLLKDHKKGLMQNLFPQEGNRVPKYRFPEFLNDGEWEEKKLEKIAIRITCKNENGSVKKVFTNSAVDGIIDQRAFFDKDIANKSNLDGYYIVEPGDYVYNPRVSSFAPVGPLAKNKTNDIGAMSPLYTVFRFNDKNNDFYEHYFKSIHWIANIRKIANTGARFDRMSISSSQLMSIKVFSPKLAEQQKIASCLSSLDELITAQAEKIEQLKLHKKGLMQGLFPKMNDRT
jgi:type I restriction enzyme S subunit